MSEPFANEDDVVARFRPLTAAEEEIVGALLSDASTRIRARFPGIDAQAAAGTIDPDVLTMITANMVKRALINPEDGVSQESQGAGPYSHSQTFANPMRNLFLTADDITTILGYQPGAGSHRYGNDTNQCGDSVRIVYSNGY
jgi:hypothetical protein